MTERVARRHGAGIRVVDWSRPFRDMGIGPVPIVVWAHREAASRPRVVT